MQQSPLSSILAFVLTTGLASANVLVVDGDTFDLDGTRIRIEGIDAPEVGQQCGTWDCGLAAVDEISKLVETGVVTCTVHGEDGYGRSLATCFVDGTDIGAEMVIRGFAWAFVKYSDSYVAEEAAARSAGVGIWGYPSVPAWNYRATKWQVAQQAAPNGCPIKGNISRGGRIYHVPWSPWYMKTRVNGASGERWFCSEAEAVASGWRAPRWK